MAMMAGAAKGPFASDAALLFELGYGPIPENAKKGIPGWSDYYLDKARLPDEIRELIAKYPDARLGVACGYNNAAALDIDTDDADIQDAILAALPAWTVAKRGSKGLTTCSSASRAIPKRFAIAPINLKDADGKKGDVFLEVLWTGRKTTIPPTIHAKTGKPYEWLDPEHTLFNTPVGELPADHRGGPRRARSRHPAMDLSAADWTANGIDCKPLDRPARRPRKEASGRRGKSRPRPARQANCMAWARTPAATASYSTPCASLGKWVHHGFSTAAEMIERPGYELQS